VYKDYLGSILTVTNATGSIVEERNYDAWGKNRNVNDWTYNNIAASNLSWLTRGYTGHEHLAQFGLINMNGRLYDPILGRMLSPDNYTQGGSQGYNRYSYAMNNPFKYTDPSGQIAFLAPIAYAGAALIGGIGNLWSNWDKVGGSWGAGIAYFASGAAGGVIGLHNVYAGSTFTATANIGIDIATGHLPQVHNTDEFINHVAKEVGLAILTAGAAQVAGQWIGDVAQKWGWLESGYTQALTKVELTDLAKDGLIPSVNVAAGVAAKRGFEDMVDVALSRSAMAAIKGRGPLQIQDVTQALSKSNFGKNLPHLEAHFFIDGRTSGKGLSEMFSSDYSLDDVVKQAHDIMTMNPDDIIRSGTSREGAVEVILDFGKSVNASGSTNKVRIWLDKLGALRSIHPFNK
jgi:RHS repeat-associated protein